jgi:HD-GYP domain-containing protein (c-di-GMP phosphodiesterase class II)
MRAITPDLFNNWAVGFLIHDIGKAAAVEYHEGEADYNRNIVIDHVKLGYTSVMNKTNYPREAGLITGYHHEYYGDSAGYGYFRAYLNQYKKNNPNAKQDFCIAYELEPILDFKAKAYFPAKILEIIDIYDSVTDPNRKYRKAMTPEEALAMMREEFVKKHRKIDAVLFDIFTDFVRGKKEDWMK